MKLNDVIKKDDAKLRRDSIKIYEYIINNFKFFINQKEIEFDCKEIEYADLTYTGVLKLDSFSFTIAPTMYFIAIENCRDNNRESIEYKKANLLVFFVNYLMDNGLVL